VTRNFHVSRITLFWAVTLLVVPLSGKPTAVGEYSFSFFATPVTAVSPTFLFGYPFIVHFFLLRFRISLNSL
jgi:hypothetical protein